jgi:hypothetical protein
MEKRTVIKAFRERAEKPPTPEQWARLPYWLRKKIYWTACWYVFVGSLQKRFKQGCPGLFLGAQRQKTPLKLGENRKSDVFPQLVRKPYRKARSRNGGDTINLPKKKRTPREGSPVTGMRV